LVLVVSWDHAQHKNIVLGPMKVWACFCYLDVKYLMQHCIYYLARLHKSSAEQDIRPACCTLAHPPCSVAQPRQFTNFGLA
jgi:hypothetical protein